MLTHTPSDAICIANYVVCVLLQHKAIGLGARVAVEVECLVSVVAWVYQSKLDRKSLLRTLTAIPTHRQSGIHQDGVRGIFREGQYVLEADRESMSDFRTTS